MPLELFMEVLMCHLGRKNKESCHCSTGAAKEWQHCNARRSLVR